ncbi:DUF6221 family protein [Streptomyces bauhiniae]|uniref:DUF6221 family protein n=1 Tax=Streptomyces bauhiniae TaxID=2340725 RepID=UPI0035DE120A
MDDLVQWLRKQFDEDEQVARDADADTWRVGEGHDGGKVLMGQPGCVVAEARFAEYADHAARHDPARVLREVEAGRRLIRAHDKWCEGRCEAKYPEAGFDAAHYWNLKVRAEVYADRPGYRQEWRP